jgi:hypothetical protein
MDVELAVAPGIDEAVRQDAHETGAADELDARAAERGVEFRVEGLARGIVAMADDPGRDAGLARDGEAARIGLVRDDGDDLRGKSGLARRRDERAQVRAAARDQNADLHARLPSAPLISTRGSPP